jgi:hypothetical protein
MPDFLKESDALGLPLTPRARTGGDEWLYEVYRCGFVHGYPSAKVYWGRKPGSSRYWSSHRGRLMLNIDGLVAGFQRGLEEFRRRADVDPELRTKFWDFIVAN